MANENVKLNDNNSDEQIFMSDWNSARQNAVTKFKKLRDKKEWITCPYLWCNVKFTTNNFRHIIYKSKKHIRDDHEIDMRCLCFLDVDKIIKKSWTCQEYRTWIEEVSIKKNWKKIKEKRIVEYFWFVAIVNSHDWKHRVRTVIKKTYWFNYAEYLSVMPAWKTGWHPNFFWDIY